MELHRTWLQMQVSWLQLTTYVLHGEGAAELQQTLADVIPLELDPLQVQWAEQDAGDDIKSPAGIEGASISQVADWDVKPQRKCEMLQPFWCQQGSSGVIMCTARRTWGGGGGINC